MAPRTALAILVTSLSCAAIAPAQELTHGYLVGSVRTDSAIVWLRTDASCEVSLLYGMEPGVDRLQPTVAVRTGEADDFVAKFALRGLTAGTRYHYAARLQSVGGTAVIADAGSFVTAPSDDSRETVTFAFSADVLLPGQFDVWDRLAAERPDLYLSLGDMPYADGARDLEGYRNAHRRVRDDTAFQQFFAAVPIAGVWDDHEVLDNWDAATDRERVALGKRVWREYMPIDGDRSEIYHSFRWGQAVEVFLLDCRAHRAVNEAPDLPGKSMLGKVQRQWFIESLAQSQAAFKLVCTSVPLRFGTTGKDSWHGFMRERQEILAGIRAAGVENVVFLAGDQHWPAAHHHPEGFVEVQAGPLAAATRKPPTHPDPRVRFLGYERSWGIVRVETEPPRLTVELHGLDGEIHRETVGVATPGVVTVTGGAATLCGPRFFALGDGEVLSSVPPGEYAVHFPAVHGEKAASLDWAMPAGGEAHVVAGMTVDSTLLWRNGFEAAHGMTVVDEGDLDGPSAWFVDTGVLHQSSNIYGGPRDFSSVRQPGTYAWFGDRKWRDCEVSVRARPEDDDVFGVMARYRDRDNYYRFSMDAERRRQRLVAVVNGSARVLAEVTSAHWPGRWYRLQLRVRGNRISALVDGREVLAAVDDSHAVGAAALYTWGNSVTAFDDVTVQALAEGSGVEALMVEDFAKPEMVSWEAHAPQQSDAPWYPDAGTLLHPGQGEAEEGAVLSALVNGDESWRDYCFGADLLHEGTGLAGVVFRYQGLDDHYRVIWDPARSMLRLERVIGGDVWVLHEEERDLSQRHWHRIACQADGFRLRIWIDDAPFASALDGAHERGRIGFLADGSAHVRFDHVEVAPPLRMQPTLASIRSRNDAQGRCEIRGVHPRAVGQDYWLAFFDDRPRPLVLESGGFGPFLVTAGDSRHFLAPGLWGEIGEDGFTASFHWPPAPRLFGTVVQVGGWVVTPNGEEIVEDLPRVRLTN